MVSIAPFFYPSITPLFCLSMLWSGIESLMATCLRSMSQVIKETYKQAGHVQQEGARQEQEH